MQRLDTGGASSDTVESSSMQELARIVSVLNSSGVEYRLAADDDEAIEDDDDDPDYVDVDEGEDDEEGEDEDEEVEDDMFLTSAYPASRQQAPPSGSWYQKVTEPQETGMSLLMNGEYGRIRHQVKSRSDNRNVARTLLDRQSAIRPICREDIAAVCLMAAVELFLIHCVAEHLAQL